MTQKEQQVSFRQKAWVVFRLALLLVVLPGGAWFYLQKGLSWRKAVQSELRQYGKIRGAYLIESGNKIDLLKGKVCVMHLFPDSDAALDNANQKVLDTADRLLKQFGQNDGFRVVMISDNPSTELKSHYQKMIGSEDAAWVWTGGTGSWRTILQNAYESYGLAEKTTPVKTYLALADTTGAIRSFYNVENEAEVERLAVHISLLLPQ